MNRLWPLAAVVALVALAGCAGGFGDGATSTVTPTQASTSTSSPTATATATDTPTETETRIQTPTPEPVDEDNPYNTRTVTVSLDSSAVNSERRLAAVSALHYWENQSSEYAGYPVSFELVPVAEEAHISIDFQNTPIDCGENDDRTSGCATVYEGSSGWTSEIALPSNEMVHITEQVAIHEVGHALGLGHGDEPARYMQAYYSTGVFRQHLQVYMTKQDGELSDELEAEIARAFDYYATDDSLSEAQKITWERVDRATEADVVIEYRENGTACFGDGNGSCWEEYDDDGRDRLYVEGIETDAVGWHVAASMAWVRYPEGEVPHQLSSDASYFLRRGDWDE